MVWESAMFFSIDPLIDDNGVTLSQAEYTC